MSSAIEILDLGSDEFNGMTCRHIRIKSYAGESPHSAWELWRPRSETSFPCIGSVTTISSQPKSPPVNRRSWSGRKFARGSGFRSRPRCSETTQKP